jgi:hypothetical protein
MAAFLQELNDKICHCDWPFIMDGDFNLIRFAWEKSSKLDQFFMDAFNSFIEDNGIKELLRKGGVYMDQ